MGSRNEKRRWLTLALTAAVLIGGGVFLRGQIEGATASPPARNSLLVLAPYRDSGTWVFDDDRVGLVREPFVAGVPEMIDALVADIPDAVEGFRLTVSAKPFPEYEAKLGWLRGDREGNYYRLDEPPATAPEGFELPEECWICPALFKYFDDAPAALYVKADAIPGP